MSNSPPIAPLASFVVTVVEGLDAGTTITLDASSPRALVGQSLACAFRVRDLDVAPRHCTIALEGDRLALADLGSPNGTTVNGVAVEKAFLVGGEKVRIGGATLVVERGTRGTAPVVPIRPMDVVSMVLAQNLQFSAARERVMREFERRYVERILAAHDGNVTRAARASGVALRYFKLVRARLKNLERREASVQESCGE